MNAEPQEALHASPSAAIPQFHLEVAVSKLLRGAGTPFSLDVAFSVQSGVNILFGRSGAGKSTLLDCVSGILRPERGAILFTGAGEHKIFFDSQAGKDLAPSARKIGYVFQGLALFPHLSLIENVAYGLSKLGRAERRERSHAMLQLFHIDQFADRKPAEISGGERQRVALARTLITEPRVLLLDEPLSALDLATKYKILEDLRAWNQARRIPILYVTHSRAEALRLGEHLILLDQGRITAQGAPRELLQSALDEE
jgi:ABC-type molybdate transport system ATPase subunit